MRDHESDLKPAIVVIGSLNMDFSVRATRLPAPGETVLGDGFRMTPGGKGANQAVTAAKLGAESVTVRMIGRVGMDLFADHLKASLAGAGVDVSGVHASRSQPTGAALICVDAAGQNQIVVASGANAELGVADVPAMRRALRGASVALFQLESPLATVAAALKVAREEGVRTILDPAPAQPLPPEMLRDVDILTPNESEAFALLGMPIGRADPAEIVGRLAALGPHMVAMKLGDCGCFFSGAGEAYRVPAFPVQAIDTTGAGDVFNGALAVALAEGSPLPHALRFANAAAALSTTRRGTQAAVPSRSEADRLL